MKKPQAQRASACKAHRAGACKACRICRKRIAKNKNKKRVGKRGVRDCLVLGRVRRPSKIVVLLHGLDDSAKCCAKGVAASWVKGLPDALIAIPQSPDRTSWSSDRSPGYDWVPTRRAPPWDALAEHGSGSKEYQDSLREYQRVLRARCRDLHAWLDALLAKHGLSNDDLVLVGFSLGSYLSAVVGAQRNARGVIVCGGPCTTREVCFGKLLPKRTRARFCAVNGTKDTLVNRRSLEDIFGSYDCEWHWSPGVGHDFPTAWYRTELKWMQGLFDEDTRP